MNKNIIFISSALQQPRHQRRIELLRQHFNVDILYFLRKKYLKNMASYANCSSLVGYISSKDYLSRIFLLIKLYFLLKKSDFNLVYCTSIDQAIISILASKKVILELGDLYQFKGVGFILSFFDKFVYKRLFFLVLTSPYFKTHYFDKNQFKNISFRTVIIENKLPLTLEKNISSFRSSKSFNDNNGKIRIGLVGMMVFDRPLKLLSNLLFSRNDIEVHAYGDGNLEIFTGNENFYYHGEFKNPDDLPFIYNSFDINYIVYDSLDENVKLALPNKLYESIAFTCPILCADDVFLGEFVESKGYGVSTKLDLDSLSDSIDFLCSNYRFFKSSLYDASKSDYLDFDSYKIIDLINCEV